MGRIEEKKSYKNVMIFTIISGIFSVLLVTVLLFTGKYIPLIITLEIGIFLIIIITIIRIYLLTRQSDTFTLKNVNFDQCPDYYSVKRGVNNREICSNEYITTDANGRQVITKFFPFTQPNEVTVPETHETGYDTIDDDKKYKQFYLSEIPTALKSVNDQCKIIKGEPVTASNFQGVSSANQLNFKEYSLLPWTYMKSKCI